MSLPRIIASCLLLASIVATGMLVYQHFSGAAIPGCSPDSPCAAAADSVWGRVPGTNVPVSFIGLAYFIALLLAYLHSRGEMGPLRWIVRLGAAASMLFVGVMLFNLDRYLCHYCLIGHVGHLGFWLIAEYTMRSAPASMTRSSHAAAPLGAWAMGFIVISASLITANAVHESRIQSAAERDLAEAARRMAEGEGDRAFTGRYLRGPEQAAIRVVVFTGYQCPDCKRFEDELERIFAERDDMSISVKHYPLNPDCNRHVVRAIHANACWAARAAEAAGMLGGPDAFWRMHHWLFERSGAFTEVDLHRIVTEMGFDVPRFIQVMAGDEMLALIREDTNEARQIGIHGTPLIFVNGVELRGWHLPGALDRAINQIAAATPEPATAEVDRPPTAFEKYVNDWRYAPERDLARPMSDRSMGSDDPRVVIEVWGDYFDALTSPFHEEMGRRMTERDDIRYIFRHFPMNTDCNPVIPRTTSLHGCAGARAAEAAARLYGREGHAAMHAWLTGATRFTETALRTAAAEMGFDVDELFAEMASPGVTQAIAADVAEAQRLGIRMVPFIFVNNRWLPRWHLPGHDVLGTVIELAASESEPAE